MGIMLSRGDKRTIPEGLYTLKADNVIATKNGDGLRFIFKIAEGDYANRILSGFTSSTLMPGTKLVDWLTELDIDYSTITEIDASMIKDKMVLGKVIHRPSKKTGDIFSNVDTIKKLKQSPAATAVKKTVASVPPPSIPAKGKPNIEINLEEEISF